MDNISEQADEMEVLKSIFEDSWKYDIQTNTYSMQIDKNVELTITLNPDYPSSKPPKYDLLAPCLTSSQRNLIDSEFKSIYESEQGSPIIFQWVEKLKEIVLPEELPTNASDITDEDIIPVIDIDKSKYLQSSLRSITHHGPVIEDRKSCFQGHACVVKDQSEVNQFCEYLLENKKIAQATHNILAFRIMLPNNTLLQDCNDDGETHAGSRLLHLLNILNLTNVAVVVSRWYGGIHLGSARFKHINNAARQVLLQGGFINQ